MRRGKKEKNLIKEKKEKKGGREVNEIEEREEEDDCGHDMMKKKCNSGFSVE